MLRIAQRLALKSTRKQRHSCLILSKGRLIAQATNNRGHAERCALFSHEAKSYKGCTLISFRVKPDGTVGKSKPCVICDQAITKAGIRKVIYFDGKVWVEELR